MNYVQDSVEVTIKMQPKMQMIKTLYFLHCHSSLKNKIIKIKVNKNKI